jgi:hypothetical protein
VLVVAWAPTTWAHGIPPGVHSPSVADVGHMPEVPKRGQDVHVRLQVVPDAKATRAAMTYCRAENYACAPSQAMRPNGTHAYAGTIAWEGRFFAGVQNVGYKFTLRYANGSEEHSPVSHWPSRPAVLPDGALSAERTPDRR